MGMTFLLETTYLLPLTILFLIVSVGALGFRASGRIGYGPFAVGVVAGLLLLAGKFVVESDVAVYASIALLIAASLWNAWPNATKGAPSAPTGPLLQLGSISKEK
jgi:hypothetical protein